MEIDWSSLIEIDDTWYSEQLNFHYKETDAKVVAEVHTVKVTGTKMLPDSLASALHYMLPQYVHGRQKMNELGVQRASLSVNKFFGKKNPDTDGKYGELLLFALVETVLKCKMVAHKIRSLSNMRDQVKGGDGLFLGSYTLPDGRIHPAYLIGESKVVDSFSDGLDEAFKSLNRFHDDVNAPEFRSTELIVAKEHILLDDRIDPNELYDRINIESKTYKDQILVHPVLIMFNSAKISTLERKALTPADLEKEVKQYVDGRKGQVAKAIANRVINHTEIAKVFLHFFIVPFNEVNKFRDAMYYAIHGVNYSV